MQRDGGEGQWMPVVRVSEDVVRAELHQRLPPEVFLVRVDRK